MWTRWQIPYPHVPSTPRQCHERKTRVAVRDRQCKARASSRKCRWNFRTRQPCWSNQMRYSKCLQTTSTTYSTTANPARRNLPKPGHLTRADVLKQYANVFQGLDCLGCLVRPISFKVDNDVLQVNMPVHCIPVSKHQKELDTLERYEKARILVKVTEPTLWCSNTLIRETTRSLGFALIQAKQWIKPLLGPSTNYQRCMNSFVSYTMQSVSPLWMQKKAFYSAPRWGKFSDDDNA